jgi:hypothetical protein
VYAINRRHEEREDPEPDEHRRTDVPGAALGAEQVHHRLHGHILLPRQHRLQRSAHAFGHHRRIAARAQHDHRSSFRGPLRERKVVAHRLILHRVVHRVLGDPDDLRAGNGVRTDANAPA